MILLLILFIVIMVLDVEIWIKLVAVALVATYVLRPTPPPDAVKIDICKMCTDEPIDLFNTYAKPHDDNAEKNYKASNEYSDFAMEQIGGAYSDKKTFDIDDLGARRQVQQQERSRESIDNRAKLNANTFRAYFGEEQETAENLSWWNIDQAIL